MARRAPLRSAAAGAGSRAARPELAQRVIVGVPAAVVAVVLIYLSPEVFAVLALLLGGAALGELWGMYDRVRPVKLAGFLALGGYAAAAHFGGEHEVLLVTVLVFPVMFVLGITQAGGSPSMTARMSLTVMGTLWIGLAIGHAILLRELPHGAGHHHRRLDRDVHR